jgi:hypothetical protein
MLNQCSGLQSKGLAVTASGADSADCLLGRWHSIFKRCQLGGVKAQGKTPMCAALRAAQGVLSGFVSQHPTCFPPIVINITDGVVTDGVFEPEALAIWNLASDD